MSKKGSSYHGVRLNELVFLRVHLAPARDKTKVEKLTGMLPQEFINYKYKEEELSPKTTANIYRVLHECPRQAVKLKILRDNPAEAVILPRHNAG